MTTTRYVALLRGINVGGKNPVPMADLRDAFEAAGYVRVATYRQSGNVVFETDGPSTALEDHIEGMLERRFAIPLTVVVRSHAQLKRVIEQAPEGFGATPGTYYSDVVFLKAPLTSRQAMKVVRVRDGVDQAWPGRGVLYFARLSERRTQSRMSSIMVTPEYRQMTIRSWATTTSVLEMLDARRRR